MMDKPNDMMMSSTTTDASSSSYQFDLCRKNSNNTNDNSSRSRSTTATPSGDDLVSFAEDGTYATELSSRPSSTSSFLLDDEVARINARPHHHHTTNTNSITETPPKSTTKSIHVVVSGEPFSVPRDSFPQLAKLPWRFDQVDEVYHLPASPAVFEVLLSHIVLQSLPAYDTLSQLEYEEFEPLAIQLGLHELIAHFGRSTTTHPKKDKQQNVVRKMGRRRAKQKQEKLQPKVPPQPFPLPQYAATSTTKKHNNNPHTPLVLNKEPSGASWSHKLSSMNHKCARVASALARSASHRFKTHSTIKDTHAQLCQESDHIH